MRVMTKRREGCIEGRTLISVFSMRPFCFLFQSRRAGHSIERGVKAHGKY